MKALIADDDVTTRRMLRVVLMRWGYEVVEASDGTEAWEHFLGPNPAPLAIVDWIMPGISGPELCRRLRGRGQVPGPYVILLTTRSHWKDVVQGLEAGADDFVAKPYQVEELGARVAVGRRIVDLQNELLKVNGALEVRVRERTEKIQSLLDQTQDLVGQLGHDLRTPLTPLMALLPILLSDERDAERREWLGLCLAQVRYLKRLALRVSDLGRLESPQTPLSLVPIQLLPVVQAATEFVGTENAAGLMERRATIDLPPALEVYGDVVWLERVFVDLLDNAFRFSPSGTPVLVTAECGEQEVVVEVTDQGQGLAPGQLKRLFDPFYMGDSARTDRNMNGLGLAICRRIVERHGGRIWAESAGVGMGTRFRFTLFRAGRPLAVRLEGAKP